MSTTAVIRKVWKILWRTLAAVILAAVLLPCALYIPAVQEWAKDLAISEVYKSTGMRIGLERLRLRFPLRVSLEGVSVTEKGDSLPMVSVDCAGVDVSLRPLLRGEIRASGLDLRNVTYRMGTPDSIMYLTAKVRKASLDDGSIGLKNGLICLDEARIDGVNVRLVMKPDTTPPPPDSVKPPTRMRIRARRIEITDLHYTMRMLPTIDSLGVDVDRALLADGTVDLEGSSIHARHLSVDSVSAAYLYPSPAFLKEHPELSVNRTDTVTSASAPWTVTADSLSLTGRRAVYAMAGATPQPGFDLNYIQASDIIIKVDSFFNRGTAISVPIRRISATERCGLTLSAAGLFAMDSTAMRVERLRMSANRSDLTVLSAMMGMGDLATDPSLPLALNAIARISPADVILAFPALRPMLAPMDGRGGVSVIADVEGSPAALRINRLAVNGAGLARIKANGTVRHFMDPTRLSGKLTLDGAVDNGSLVARILPAGTLPEGLLIPKMTLAGTVDFAQGPRVAGNLRGTAADGSVALQGKWIARAESYDADLRLNAFPVNAFMPSLGIGHISADLKAHGTGYNPLALSTRMDVDVNLHSIEYQGQTLSDLTASATIGGGRADAYIKSANRDADLDLTAHAEMLPERYTWDLDGRIRHLDLLALKLSADTCSGSVDVVSNGTYDPRNGDIHGTVDLTNLAWTLPGMHLAAPDASATIGSTTTNVDLDASTGDFSLKLNVGSPLKEIMAQVQKLPAVIDTMVMNRRIDVRKLQQAIPGMMAVVSMGPDNILAQALAERGTEVENLYLAARNDSLIRITGHAYSIKSGKTAIDTVRINAFQRGENLAYTVNIDNAPGTMDNFAHVRFNGFLADNRFSLFARQTDIQGKQGYNIGLLASVADSVVTARLVPRKPTIAYRQFSINEGNFVSFNLQSRRIKADLALSDGRTDVRLYTEAPPDSIAGSFETLVADIKHLQLSDYITLSPFAPPISGDLSTNMRFNYTPQGLTGTGSLALDNFFYDRKKVGNFDANLDVFTDPATGLLRASADMLVDGRRAMTVNGFLNDSTASDPLQLDLRVIHLPLRVANPFLPGGVARLDGTLNGRMDVTGKGIDMRLNGSLQFDSASVFVPMAGTSIRFPETEIPVKDSKVYFDEYQLFAVNENPLTINGSVDITNPANPGVDLNLYAHDMQLLNSSKPKGADVYGKGFFDINANVKGNMDVMVVDASVDLLPGSTVTYVLSPSQSAALQNASNSDMVHFVQFADSAAVGSADQAHASSMALILTANIILSQGCAVQVDLNPEGTNKVRIQPQGELTYTQTPVNPDGRMTGRITISDGFVRYTPPLMSEKHFTIQDGTYVAFTGPILNPQLNIQAVDKIKANVTRQGENSRLVNFDVLLSVTGTLENMNVKFDLSTIDDITVSNELAAMSPDQRANQAMNMLLYGVYNANGTTGDSNIGGNLLYSFVESTLNNWMANNIKGVDISFGIDQYDKTVNGNTSTATNYSYHVSKTLFNDRFKIIVGGTYTQSSSPDADDNLAESLFNDISAEYMLDRAGSMYIRIFRHTGYESILEGEVTQTGVGFVYRRRINSIRDMFRFLSRSPKTQTAQP